MSVHTFHDIDGLGLMRKAYLFPRRDKCAWMLAKSSLDFSLQVFISFCTTRCWFFVMEPFCPWSADLFTFRSSLSLDFENFACTTFRLFSSCLYFLHYDVQLNFCFLFQLWRAWALFPQGRGHRLVCRLAGVQREHTQVTSFYVCKNLYKDWFPGLGLCDCEVC